eukprot:13234290-Heterocapsa_arctica.AAC.1
MVRVLRDFRRRSISPANREEERLNERQAERPVKRSPRLVKCTSCSPEGCLLETTGKHVASG